MDEDVTEIKSTKSPGENTSNVESVHKDTEEVVVVASKDSIKNSDPIKPVTSDGNHNELAPNMNECFKTGPKKSQIPRIIANNFKSTHNTTQRILLPINLNLGYIFN